MLTKDVLFIKVFCVTAFVAWVIFLVLDLQNDNFEFSASGDRSGFRINKRSGEVEHCNVVTQSNLKRDVVLCIPEKKHDKKTFLSSATSKNIDYEELAKEYGGKIVFGPNDQVVEGKVSPASK